MFRSTTLWEFSLQQHSVLWYMANTKDEICFSKFHLHCLLICLYAGQSFLQKLWSHRKLHVNMVYVFVFYTHTPDLWGNDKFNVCNTPTDAKNSSPTHSHNTHTLAARALITLLYWTRRSGCSTDWVLERDRQTHTHRHDINKNIHIATITETMDQSSQYKAQASKWRIGWTL